MLNLYLYMSVYVSFVVMLVFFYTLTLIVCFCDASNLIDEGYILLKITDQW